MKRNISLMIIVLLSIMLLSSCNDLTHSKPIIENHTDPTSSDCQTGMSFITSTDFSDNETFSEESIDYQNTQLEKKEANYVYAPPIEAFESNFAVDNIVRKVEFSYYHNGEFGDLPKKIFDELIHYVTTNNLVAENERLEWIGVDKFDINSDGTDDFIIEGQVMPASIESVSAGDYPHQYFNRIYVSDNEEYFAFDFPTSKYKCYYILSSACNGYSSFISDLNSLSLIYFDGSEYVTKTIGADYTWEYLDNSIVKITCYPYQIEDRYVIAKCLYDSNIVQHTLFYSCLADGSPCIPSDEKIDFYIELTEYAPQQQNDFWIGPIEIKYVAVDSSRLDK